MAQLFTLSPIFLLVFGFIFTIVLQAWFVRRLSNLRGALQQRRGECDRLYAEATVLGETVSDFKHGIESNAVSVQVLEREIDELRGQVEDFLEQHEEQSEEAVAEVQSNGE